jgi:O-antigen/teichoic acid export membrane protein
LVAGRLGKTATAYFQTPWLGGTSFDFLLFSIATSLVVESSARPGAAADGVRRAVRLSARVLLPGMVVIVVGAPWFLRILGPDYASHGTRLLQLLALALPFMGVNVLYVTYARLARRVRRVVVTQVCVTTLVLGLTVVLLGPLGITGAGLAFLWGQAIVAFVVLPSVIRQYRHRDMAPDFSGSGALVAKGRASGADAATDTDAREERR